MNVDKEQSDCNLPELSPPSMEKPAPEPAPEPSQQPPRESTAPTPSMTQIKQPPSLTQVKQPPSLTQVKQPPSLTQVKQPPSIDPSALFSGGGISFLTGNKNAKFSYGYATFKGKRASMEDYYETSISEVDGQMVAFFGVFDGHWKSKCWILSASLHRGHLRLTFISHFTSHGGSRTAEYLKNNLFKNLSSHPDFIKDTKSAIVEAFKQTDVDYLNEEKGQQKDAGSTASTAVLLGDRLLVANVGDSRVVACRDGSAIPLSIDHKPDRSDERERIEQAGGFIIWAGTWRVGGVLAVSRAFGDKMLKPYVVADPEIQEEEIDGVQFLIVASDGLWNVLSNEEAVTIVQDIKDAEAASRKLIEEAYSRGSSDNITCVVVRFEST
ncbi:probable protein phosphatase 2C 45 isoform X1 [Solanum lycopersicum]|uniref:probable protein phosphatase 2C 45 isoform X1 n=1 Tax=Solanum lycopersicum TaxID=4081 RepID=UPI000532A94A|nr:probable protein phosphatase 2C 45 isoform X1 [Solanum lycopersicum]